ncbi:hypothetical protein DFA_07834 [Cavenderia fasciculata]|uniref:Uncharacterized protein n=1 Tax=Cavenderia fasciculata TaxID=261658 RepID=F4Q3N9_CACFS|nr:uncharacterized protein DFA_07834 [Cavenderia fasciculata]EGG16855.1 hypothetical protein DFA_07834 [Cavenderia fasciculata]|eukprot:XP_004355329.1 hypothetical protein DFA_07834 [Cavenderia fasciculata]
MIKGTISFLFKQPTNIGSLETLNYYSSSGIKHQISKQFKIHVPRGKVIFKYPTEDGKGGYNINNAEKEVVAKINLFQADWISDHCKSYLKKNYSSSINDQGEFIVSSSKYPKAKLNEKNCLDKMEKILTQASILRKDQLALYDEPSFGNERRLVEKKIRSQIKSGRGVHVQPMKLT